MSSQTPPGPKITSHPQINSFQAKPPHTRLAPRCTISAIWRR